MGHSAIAASVLGAGGASGVSGVSGVFGTTGGGGDFVVISNLFGSYSIGLKLGVPASQNI